MCEAMHRGTGLFAFVISCCAFLLVNGQSETADINRSGESTTTMYWPPAYNAETMAVEKILAQQLELGCSASDVQTKSKIHSMHKASNNSSMNSKNANTTDSMPSTASPTYFMISETENKETLNNPHPTTFVHIPSGQMTKLSFECDDCANNKINFNGIDYDTTRFDCKTMCIFTAQKSYTESCRKGQMYKIGLRVHDRFYKLLESCHHLEMPSNVTFDAKTIVWKLGKFSRTMQNDKSLCQPKCMPVCRAAAAVMERTNGTAEQPTTTAAAIDEIESDLNEKGNFALQLMQSVCSSATKNAETIRCDEGKNGANAMMAGQTSSIVMILMVQLVLSCMVLYV